MAVATKRHKVSDIIRAHEHRYEPIDTDDKLLAFMDAAEDEALPALLMRGGLMSFGHDGGNLDMVIDRVARQVAPDEADIDTHVEKLEEALSNRIWQSRWNRHRAAYCLGLAIGLRLAGER